MTEKKSNIITLKVDGVELSFEPNRTAYNGLINEMTMTNKIAPVVTYLGRVVVPESKDALNQLLEKYPSVELQIVESVNSVYSPKVEIEIKN